MIFSMRPIPRVEHWQQDWRYMRPPHPARRLRGGVPHLRMACMLAVLLLVGGAMAAPAASVREEQIGRSAARR
jgi:hypothetical protein